MLSHKTLEQGFSSQSVVVPFFEFLVFSIEILFTPYKYASIYLKDIPSDTNVDPWMWDKS